LNELDDGRQDTLYEVDPYGDTLTYCRLEFAPSNPRPRTYVLRGGRYY